MWCSSLEGRFFRTSITRVLPKWVPPVPLEIGTTYGRMCRCPPRGTLQSDPWRIPVGESQELSSTCYMRNMCDAQGSWEENKHFLREFITSWRLGGKWTTDRPRWVRLIWAGRKTAQTEGSGRQESLKWLEDQGRIREQMPGAQVTTGVGLLGLGWPLKCIFCEIHTPLLQARRQQTDVGELCSWRRIICKL